MGFGAERRRGRGGCQSGGGPSCRLPCAFALAALMLSGCPREPEPPEPAGQACERLADCNADRQCGTLTACVSGFCEAGKSLTRPCPGEGVPARPP